MLIKSSLVCAGLFIAGISFADTYNCGLWLDNSEEPAATASYDTAEANARMSAGNFIGVVKKQDDGSDSES